MESQGGPGGIGLVDGAQVLSSSAELAEAPGGRAATVVPRGSVPMSCRLEKLVNESKCHRWRLWGPCCVRGRVSLCTEGRGREDDLGSLASPLQI